MTQARKRSSLPPILFILLGLILVFVMPKLALLIQQSLSRSFNPESGINRISSGEKSLIASGATAEKRSGIEAYAKKDYSMALEQFEAALKQQRNDPETVIYRNNARAYASHHKILKIAASVPIGSNPNVASEILRGVAQAQDEINSKGGINQSDLVITIVDDSNNPGTAKQIATELVKNDQILAVVGHNASNVSLEAAPVYQQSGLVMVSPTSFAGTLSGIGNYIFRTVPTTRAMASRLAEYTVKTAQKSDVAVCYDSQSSDSASFKDELATALADQGGRIMPTACDFASPTFNASAAMQEIRSRGAKAIVLSPHIDRISKAIELARANQGQLPLLSTPTLYTLQTLQEGKSDVNGLVFPAAWHPQAHLDRPFSQAARQRWGGEVSWRTATSYDATEAIIAGLQQSQTRSGLQQALRSPSFITDGAGDTIRFDPQTGDRKLPIQLVQVQPSNASRSGTGYDFVPVEPRAR